MVLRLDFKTAIAQPPAVATVVADIKKNPMNAPVTLFHVPSLQNLIFDQLLKDKGSLKSVFEYFNKHSLLESNEALKNAIYQRLVLELLQATIDDDYQKVKTILDFDPQLLLIEPRDVGVTEIESKLPWQRFLTEKPFIMAQKLKRFAMTSIMLTYFEKIAPANDMKAGDAKDAKSEAEKQWVFPEFLDVQFQPKEDEDLQKKYIKDYLNPLIETIAFDNTVEVDWINEEAQINKLNERTNQALQTFRDILLPNRAIAIDECLDIEQFLIAANKVYSDDVFQNWHQQQVYIINVISFILGLAPPPLSKAYCSSLYDVVLRFKPIKKEALVFKMHNGQPFYRISRDSHFGLGFTFFLGDRGQGGSFSTRGVGGTWWILANYVQLQRMSFANLHRKFLPKRNLKFGL